jgi:hypothetical protein
VGNHCDRDSSSYYADTDSNSDIYANTYPRGYGDVYAYADRNIHTYTYTYGDRRGNEPGCGGSIWHLRRQCYTHCDSHI